MSVRLIIAGGGTGGHIFPALAIAGALLAKDPQASILFVGAKGKMEMEKVPQAGYRIVGLDIAGFNRNSLLKNLTLPWKLLKSFWQVRKVFASFAPHAVLGVGGYSSFPVLRYAQQKGIPSFLHEANAYAGRSNRMLAKRATLIFTGTRAGDPYFLPTKTRFTGNPVRASITADLPDRAAASAWFSLEAHRPILLVVGGSLGARSINEAVDGGLDQLLEAGVQVIWQTGTSYAQQAANRVQGRKGCYTAAFIDRMDMAYAAAHVVVARSGAMTVAELAVVAKPVIFVPYPLAAEDHQRINAQELVSKNAALLVSDQEASQQLITTALQLCLDPQRQQVLSTAIAAFAVRDAARQVADQLINALPIA